MPDQQGPGTLSEQVDTGFDAVLAGEKWEPLPEITVGPAPAPQPHVCASAAGGTRCDICFGPVTATVTPPPQPDIEPAKSASGLTDAGVQAAKALVALPATLDPPMLARLAREIAMDIKERHRILGDFNLTQVQYDFLEAHNEFYKAALQAACIEWHAPLSTQERIKVEAAAILEDSLPGLGVRMQNRGEGLPGVIEAAKLFAKVAGVGERESSGAGAGERFTINIDLGGDQKITVSTAQTESSHPQLDSMLRISEDAGSSAGGSPVLANSQGPSVPRSIQGDPEG